MANHRKSISPKLRFEVFKRDKFQCQYCGKSAPQVLLHVDHIEPVAEGGTNDITNLITACSECNLGKGARRLSDDATIRKEKRQLDMLNERREQLEMMMRWRKELSEMEEQTVSYVESCFSDKTGYSLLSGGKQILRQSLHMFSLCEVLDALEICAAQYGRFESSVGMTKESANKVLNMIYPVCKHKRDGNFDQSKESIFYTAGILHNRFNFPKKQFMPRLLKASQLGVDPKQLKEIALSVKNYQNWRIAMDTLLNESVY